MTQIDMSLRRFKLTTVQLFVQQFVQTNSQENMKKQLYYNQPVNGGFPFAFYQQRFILILAWIYNHIPSEVWDEIAEPLPNPNGRTVKVRDRLSNFVPHFIYTLYNGCDYLFMLWSKLSQERVEAMCMGYYSTKIFSEWKSFEEIINRQTFDCVSKHQYRQKSIIENSYPLYHTYTRTFI